MGQDLPPNCGIKLVYGTNIQPPQSPVSSSLELVQIG